MRIAIASSFGYETCFALRLMAEGHEVKFWIKEPACKTYGNGLVPKAGQWPELLAWARDGARTGVSLAFFGSSGIGDLADEAQRAGIRTVGGGGFMDKLEKDREFGFKIAADAGCKIPPYQEFKSIDECIAWAQSNPVKPSYWKTDKYLDGDTTHGVDDAGHLIEYLEGVRARYGGNFKNIVQEKIDGVPLSTARWWNGHDWVGPYEGTYENKKFMNGGIGPSTGCSFNAVWFYEDETPIIAQELCWNALSPAFRTYQAPPGIYDINAIVDEQGQAWFLEWTPRCGYDSEPTSTRLLPDLGRHLYSVAYGHTPPEPSYALAYALRLSVPPYPWEHGHKDDKGSCDGLQVHGADLNPRSSFVPYCVRIGDRGLEVAGAEGALGLVYTQGEDIFDLGEQALEEAKKLNRTAGLQYRTDGHKDCAEQAQELLAAGIDDVHIGLLRESEVE